MILSDQQLLELKIKLEELITEREGMIWTNFQRVHLEQPMAYDDYAFLDIKNRMKTIREQLEEKQKGGPP